MPDSSQVAEDELAEMNDENDDVVGQPKSMTSQEADIERDLEEERE